VFAVAFTAHSVLILLIGCQDGTYTKPLHTICRTPR